jgi:hypothetical protein
MPVESPPLGDEQLMKGSFLEVRNLQEHLEGKSVTKNRS